MKISKHIVASINYTLKNDDDVILDSSQGQEPLSYLHGAQNLIPGLENELEGKTAGDSFSARIAPKDAYGEKDESKIQQVPREMFGDETFNVGDRFHAAGPDGAQIIVTVVDKDDQHVTVDGNHPMAGIFLNFDVEVVDVRAATNEEISHGHIHDKDGHCH